jgi:hypothetical protein
MRPPEACGGPWGYAEKLHSLSYAAHEHHEQALDILGDDHDPHARPNTDLILARLQTFAMKWTLRSLKAK